VIQIKAPPMPTGHKRLLQPIPGHPLYLDLEVAVDSEALMTTRVLPISNRSSRFFGAVLISATLFFLSQMALAQSVFTQQGPKLVGTLAVGNAQQGWSVALAADGNTAIVGGAFDNSYTGAAWVYSRSNGVWTQQGSKLGP
jgi:hypothetical protein